MRRLPLSLVAATIASLVIAGCSSQAAPAPTSAPAASSKASEPTRAVEPTKAPAQVAPTAAPTAPPKVEFPVKGKTITIICGWAAGGGTDLSARFVAAGLEKRFGVPVEVVNKTAGAGQAATTEVVNSKPDGYTMAATSLGTNATYLDPDRKATYGRKDIQPVALHDVDPGVVAVATDSPYKTMKDFIDDAKAKPTTIKVGDAGLLSSVHMGVLQVQKLTGAEFVSVHFNGSAPARTALLGGHIDVQFAFASEFLSEVKSGKARLLGVMDKEPSHFYPGLKTMDEQGIKIFWASPRGYAVRAGTPREIVNILSGGIKKVTEDPEHQKKIENMGSIIRYMDATQFENYWDELDAIAKPLIALAKQ